jgi:hypothetical protein
MRRPAAAVAASVLLTLAASCGGSPEPAATSSAPASSSATPTASGASATHAATATAVAVSPGAEPGLRITSPKAGTTVVGNAVTVSVEVRNFNVVNKIGGKNAFGEGHLFFYLDVEDIPTKPGEEAVAAGEGRYVESPNTSHTWNGLAAGDHLFGVQLVNNDHTPLQPPVTAKIHVTVGS